MIRRLCISLFLINALVSFSQVSNISTYLDDGGRTEASDIIKSDFSEIIQANIPIIWEHKFHSGFALQGGIGLLVNHLYKPIIKPVFASADFKSDLQSGFSLYLQPLYYYTGFESLHVGIPIHFKQYGNMASSFEFNLGIGKQWLLSRHLAVDIETGVGMNFEYSLDKKSYIYNLDIIDPHPDIANSFRSRIIFPISIKVGYVL